MFCLKKDCNENLSQKLNEAGSEEIDWGLGQNLSNMLLWLLKQIENSIKICQSAMQRMILTVFCVGSFLDGNQIGYRKCVNNLLSKLK